MTELPFPVYCINIEKCKDRLLAMQKRIPNLIRWNAITPESELFNNNSSFGYKTYHNMKPFEKGCAISHYSLWKYLLDNNIDMALILEDDVVFRSGWETILMNGIKSKLLWNMFMLNSSEDAKINNQWVLSKNQWLTGGYLISKNGLKWLVENFKNELYPSDYMLVQMQNKTNLCFVLFPWLAVQEGKDSTIQNQDHVDADHQKVVRLLNTTTIKFEDYK